MNINGEEVAKKRKVYEKRLLVAWSNEESVLKLATTIMKENSEMKDRFGIDAIEVSLFKPPNYCSRLEGYSRDPGLDRNPSYSLRTER